MKTDRHVTKMLSKSWSSIKSNLTIFSKNVCTHACTHKYTHTYKHGQVLRCSDCGLHHLHHVLMGDHLLTRNTGAHDSSDKGENKEERGTPTGGAVGLKE